MGERFDLLTGRVIKEPAKRRAPEAAVGREVDAFLAALGGYVRTINSGGVKTAGRWRSSGQGSGISDRLAWLPGGKCVAVELKAPGKKRTLSEPQFNFLMRLLERDHVACVADSVGCVKLALKQSQAERIETLKTVFAPRRQGRSPDLPEWLR